LLADASQLLTVGRLPSQSIRSFVPHCGWEHSQSKGICYIEYETVEGAVQALALNGTLLNNMPVLVKPSEAEKVGCIDVGCTKLGDADSFALPHII
jgi:hypothetical protein